MRGNDRPRKQPLGRGRAAGVRLAQAAHSPSLIAESRQDSERLSVVATGPEHLSPTHRKRQPCHRWWPRGSCCTDGLLDGLPNLVSWDLRPAGRRRSPSPIGRVGDVVQHSRQLFAGCQTQSLWSTAERPAHSLSRRAFTFGSLHRLLLRWVGDRFGQMSCRAYCGDYQRTLLLTSGW
jgi:hypothetical protein